MFPSFYWWHVDWCMKCPQRSHLRAAVRQAGREALFGWSWREGLTQRMNIWRSWVVTSETRLPTAFLLVYWWRDDTEELGSTLYKGSLSAARHSLKDHCCWNFSFRSSRTGSRRETAAFPSIMSEVGTRDVLRRVGLSQITHEPCASPRREMSSVTDFTGGRAAVLGGFLLADDILPLRRGYRASDAAQLLRHSSPNGRRRCGAQPGAWRVPGATVTSGQ